MTGRGLRRGRGLLGGGREGEKEAGAEEGAGGGAKALVRGNEAPAGHVGEARRGVLGRETCERPWEGVADKVTLSS